MEYDEITGMMIDVSKDPLPPMFIITDKETETIGHACAPTHAEAMRLQMELGLRATTKIIEV